MTTPTARCPAKCWSYHGRDTLQCVLLEDHDGPHNTGRMFATPFSDEEWVKEEAMSKTWDGPTPIVSGSLGPLMDAGFAQGFIAAKNEDMPMYEALKEAPSGAHDHDCGSVVVILGETMLDESLCSCWQHRRREALAAYEAGLVEDLVEWTEAQ